MAEEKQYATRLMHIKCSCGTKVNYLNAPTDHGIRLASGEPVLNANDHEPGEGKNIVHFGRCKSLTNPGNALMAGAAFALGAATGCGLVLSVAAGAAGASVIDELGCCKCNPKTFTPWEGVSEDHLIEGAPALTTDSQLTCFYGGVIEITDDEVG